MNVVSLFSGIGGFDLALERCGMKIVAQVEVDSRCRELLARKWPESIQHEDVREVDGGDWSADVLCGGFPCQDISIAGRRAGLAGERSGLWWEFHRILAEIRPTWCLIENVAGLPSSGGRRDLGAILGALGDLGYGFAYRVLDAQWFGVAQRRRRVFIVGHLGDWRAPARVLLEPEGGYGDSPPSREAREAVAALTRNGVGTCGADDNQAQAGHLVPTAFHLTQDPITAEDMTPALSTGNGRGCSTLGVIDKPTPLYYSHDNQAQAGHLIPVPQTFDWQVAGSGRTWIHDKPGGPCRSLTSHKTMAVVLDKPTPLYYSHDYNQDRVYDGRGISEALTTARRPNFMVEQMVRRLTPLECERLQGFPDYWTEGFSDNQRYRMLGNAVAVPVVEWIGRRIMAEEAA